MTRWSRLVIFTCFLVQLAFQTFLAEHASLETRWNLWFVVVGMAIVASVEELANRFSRVASSVP